MQLADLDEVLAIERASFATPWSRESFVSELEGNRFARLWVCRTAGSTGKVAGYLSAWLIYEELRIQNVAVAQPWRRQGIAAQLLRHALLAGQEGGCLEALLEVRPGNEAALGLYRRFGFEPAGHRSGYYSDTGEDALLLARPLTTRSG
jgi:ribosomal-protein-alanine N-acetyltransferase